MAILTDKSAITALTVSDLLHAVDVSDTSGDPAGTSKKATLQKIIDLINGEAQLTNGSISASAAIAYAKLALANSILNADINASAAIVYSKLNLNNSLVIGDHSASGTPDATKFLRGDNQWAVPAGSGDMVLASVQTVTGAKTFLDDKLLIQNPAGSFAYTLQAGAIIANRVLNLPVIAGTDTLVVLALAQVLTNKTIDADLNTLSNISNTQIKALAGIVYSKLSLSNSILNADINSSAAIDYSKLNLVGTILNADINASAAIAKSKLAPLAIVDADVSEISPNKIPLNKWKEPVRVATTADGALATAYENGDAIDGITLSTGDRILLKDQSTGAENGIYTVNASGAPTRATDWDGSTEAEGAIVYCREGTANAGKAWKVDTVGTITIGTTSVAITEFGGGSGGGGDTDSVKWKEPVRVATISDGTLSTAYENGDTVDGITLSTGDRILLKDQSTGAENGIYTVNATGAPTRATDFDGNDEVLGAMIVVLEGTVNKGKIWRMTNTGSVTVGTTALTFEDFRQQDNPRVISKTADQTVNNTSTLVNDNDLFVPLLANRKYYWFSRVRFKSDSTPDLKISWTVPSGATGGRRREINNATEVSYGTSSNWSGSTGVDRQGYAGGYVETGGTAGNLQFQWAQNTADLSDTTVYKGSVFTVFDLGEA